VFLHSSTINPFLRHESKVYIIYQSKLILRQYSCRIYQEIDEGFKEMIEIAVGELVNDRVKENENV